MELFLLDGDLNSHMVTSIVNKLVYSKNENKDYLFIINIDSMSETDFLALYNVISPLENAYALIASNVYACSLYLLRAFKPENRFIFKNSDEISIPALHCHVDQCGEKTINEYQEYIDDILKVIIKSTSMLLDFNFYESYKKEIENFYYTSSLGESFPIPYKALVKAKDVKQINSYKDLKKLFKPQTRTQPIFKNIMIQDEVNLNMLTYVLNEFSDVQPGDNVLLTINSLGGRLDVSNSISELIKLYQKAGVNIYACVINECASAASHIFAAVKPENRFIVKDVKSILVHAPKKKIYNPNTPKFLPYLQACYADLKKMSNEVFKIITTGFDLDADLIDEIGRSFFFNDPYKDFFLATDYLASRKNCHIVNTLYDLLEYIDNPEKVKLEDICIKVPDNISNHE